MLIVSLLYNHDFIGYCARLHKFIDCCLISWALDQQSTLSLTIQSFEGRVLKLYPRIFFGREPFLDGYFYLELWNIIVKIFDRMSAWWVCSYWASTTLGLGLGLCPLASHEFTGPWNGNALSPHGNHPQITVHVHPFQISHLFLNLKWILPHLNYYFSKLIPSKIGKNCCEMWNRNEACPTTSPMNSGNRSNLKVVLALYLIDSGLHRYIW